MLTETDVINTGMEITQWSKKDVWDKMWSDVYTSSIKHTNYDTSTIIDDFITFALDMKIIIEGNIKC